MTEVLFWKGIISPRDDLRDFEETVSKLLQGEYKAANLDLKKCRGLSLYTARVNRSDRLLFTTVEKDNKPYLLLLEVIPNHDYQKSRFLNNPVLLKQFIENADIQHASVVTAANIHDLDSEESSTLSNINNNASNPDQNTIVERPIFYFNQRYLSFNQRQEQAVQAKLPMIISGAPGSGKSCVALSFLASATEALSDDNTTRKALYITRSPFLVEQMSRSWSALPASLCSDFEVDFKSYEELLLTAEPQLAKRELCDIVQFESWFTSDFIRQAQNRQQLNSASHSPLQNLVDKKALLYQELRIASGHEKKDYISLGHKQSLFQEEDERALLYRIFKAYSRYLNENNYYDPAFCDLSLLQGYDLVVMDEGQDFSLQQLKNLLALAGDNLCICYDPNQSLSDAQSILAYLKDHFYQKQINVTNIAFHETYRCPANIAAMANVVLDIKQQLAGRADKQEAEAIIPVIGQSNEGEVRWLDSLDEAERNQIAEQANHTDFAIITTEEFKEEARALFKTPLIFTPAEIKGLEYPVVLIYRLIEGVDFIQASKSLNAGKHIDKRDLRPAFNALFTAFTRAQTTLIIYQPPHHPTAELITRLKKGLPQIDSTRKPLVHALNDASRSTDWVNEYQRQLTLGNVNQANAIQRQYLPQKADIAASALPEVAASAANKQAARPKSNQPNPRMRKKNRNALALKPQAPRQTTLKPKAVRLNKAQENLLKNLSKHCTFNFLKKVFSKDDVLELLFEKNPLDPKSDMSLFGLMMGNDETINQISNFLEKNPVFIKKLTLRLLDKPCEFGNDDEHASHFLQMVMSTAGRSQKILRLIFEANPDIPEHLTMDKLFTYYTDFKINQFFALSATKDGIQCLRILLRTNKDFINHLQAGELFSTAYNPINEDKHEYTNTVFNFLSAAFLAEEYFLYELIQAKPELVEGATARDLFSVYKQAEHTSHLLSAAYLFSSSLKGLELLHIIFSKNKHLAESNEANSMFKTEYRHLKYAPSAFSLLSTKSAGIMVLNLIFYQNESLLQQIKLDDFFRIYPFNHGEDSMDTILVSAFSMLCKHGEGAGLLYKILTSRKDILDAIAFEHLLKTNATTDSDMDLSNNNLLYLLENNNLDVIELIFKTHPELIDGLQPQHLDLKINLSISHRLARKTLRDFLKSEALAPIKALIQSRHPALFYQETSLTHPSRLFSSNSPDKDAAAEESANTMQPDV